MAYVRVWKFRPRPGSVAAFEAAYGPGGDWARLFVAAPGFLGTTLLKGGGTTPEYLTLDRWASRQAWENFRRQRAGEYAELDRHCEAMTDGEEDLGSYDETS